MDNFDPHRSVGFLVGRVYRTLNARIAEVLAEGGFGLSAEEMTVMLGVVYTDPPQRMGPLAELLGRDPTTLKRQLDALVDSGLVSRQPCPCDGRAVVISATPAGEQLVEQAMPLLMGLKQRAVNGISPSQYEMVADSLDRMLRNLRAETLLAQNVVQSHD